MLISSTLCGKRLIEGADYFVRVVPFPAATGTIDGFVALNSDGTYSIYIDANASEHAQKIALKHELAHIAHDDFYNDDDITEKEKRASCQ